MKSDGPISVATMEHDYLVYSKYSLMCDYSRDEEDAEEAINSMPGVYRYGINQLEKILQPLVAKGLQSVLLFGVSQHLEKVTSAISTNPCNICKMYNGFPVFCEATQEILEIVPIVLVIIPLTRQYYLTYLKHHCRTLDTINTLNYQACAIIASVCVCVFV